MQIELGPSGCSSRFYPRNFGANRISFPVMAFLKFTTLKKENNPVKNIQRYNALLLHDKMPLRTPKKNTNQGKRMHRVFAILHLVGLIGFGKWRPCTVAQVAHGPIYIPKIRNIPEIYGYILHFSNINFGFFK